MTGRSPRDAVEWHRRVTIEEAEPLASGDSSLPGAHARDTSGRAASPAVVRQRSVAKPMMPETRGRAEDPGRCVGRDREARPGRQRHERPGPP